MKTVIYADVLVTVNFIVNYFLLRACAAITGHSFRTWRLIISSLIGGIFSIVIFIDNINVPLNMLIKSVLFTVMVLTAFGAKNIKSFLKNCASFALVNFGFAGIMFALCTSVVPNAAIYKNGIVYFDISLVTLTVSAIICYCVLSIISRLTKSKVPQKSIYEIKIHYNNETANGKALFDSGNTLCDCFSGRPVIIAEKEFVRTLFPDDDLTSLRNFRLIPYSTINNGGALPAFMADKVEIYIKNNWIVSEEIYIAITDKKIVSGGYSALFGVPLYETVENNIKGGIIAV